jgi:predicted component of type VI protein secretion system
MDFELEIVQGRSASNKIKLIDGVTTIGRHDECQLRIKSSQVSRKHCELFEKKGLLLVKDLGSSNGTIVNGKRIKGQRVLEPGDQLTIGPVQLRVTKVGEGSPSGKPASSPGDTAVSAAAPAAEAPEDFVIDFDEGTGETEAPTVASPAPARKPAPKGKAAAHDDDAIADFLMDIEVDEEEAEAPPKAAVKATPAPAPTSAVEVESSPAPAKEKELARESEKEKEVSDDAIADFLLDIKLDDDE